MTRHAEAGAKLSLLDCGVSFYPALFAVRGVWG